ncbi:unnamed protein product [Caenorhabditis angaria]|uniref:DIRP domain-containing protein n=1 Tax=Caenorhabditis angaria TaxID=860376 RepID=A0A9P1IJI7_9PELO|nr:unnamed protein product [Caenorhabditis angaria]
MFIKRTFYNRKPVCLNNIDSKYNLKSSGTDFSVFCSEGMSAAVRSPRKKVSPEQERDNTSTRYRLRENSKLPSRYRDDEVFVSPSRPKKSTSQSPKKPIVRRAAGKDSPSLNNYATSKLNLLATSAIDHESASSSSSTDQFDLLTPKEETEQPKRGPARRVIQVSPPPKQQQQDGLINESEIMVGVEEEVEGEAEDEEEFEYDESGMKISKHDEFIDMQTFFDMFNDAEREEMIAKFSNYQHKSQRDVSRFMRGNLKKLYNMLKYKKARQWIVCEFFYSGIDEQIFRGENEFASIIKESFPNLKNMMLNKTEWRTIRRLLGKPRRCSALFFEEERLYLEEKRLRIRSVYEGSYLNDPSIDLKDLPAKLPKQLVVGSKVYARVRQPRDGIYAGTVDALVPNGYRVVFEKRELPPTLVRDTEVVMDGTPELLSIAYFIEQANSKLPNGVRPFVTAVRDANRPHLVKEELIARPIGEKAGPLKGPNDARLSARNPEMVGNFPLRFLVNLVKLTKLIEIKKGLVKQLMEMNAEAELNNLTTSKYSAVFQEKYSKIVIDLEHVNQNIDSNMSGIQEHNMYYASNSEVTNVKPETVRKFCYQQAGRFVEHCNQGLNVENVHALTLIQSLTAALLQVRSLGNQKISACDLNSLSDTINSIRQQISPKNASFFQDYVEVHMKQFHKLMIDNGAISGFRR